MRFLKFIINMNAQKQMARLSFGQEIDDLNYFELNFFFHIS